MFTRHRKGTKMTVAAPEPQQIAAGEMREWELENRDAMEVEGYSLYGGKDNDRKLDALVGVPFLIKAVTFRMGDITPDGQTEPRDYVSVECLIHPMHAHRFERKYVVFNDGSTGIYRQIVAALALNGYVELNEDLPEKGHANTTRYDASFSADNSESGGTEFALKLRAPEGLRKSAYDNPDGSEGFTWFLA
jgi:hypothetical protein